MLIIILIIIESNLFFYNPNSVNFKYFDKKYFQSNPMEKLYLSNLYLSIEEYQICLSYKKDNDMRNFIKYMKEKKFQYI